MNHSSLLKCQTKRETYSSSLDGGFQCQFEGLYKKITNKHYSDFYEDFFQYDKKNYCPFHAPINAIKINGDRCGRAKKEVLSASYVDNKIEETARKSYLEKFYNVIYGVINQQSALFSESFKQKEYRLSSEEEIDFQEIVFPSCLTLTKVEPNGGEEYKKYSKDLDNIIPFINFANCEFRGIEAKSGAQSNEKIYPNLIINGASFANSSFVGNVELIGVNFVPRKQHNFGVSFDRANFQCAMIKFTGSEFFTLSFKNAKIRSYFIEFTKLLIHNSFDMSCDYEVEYDLKKIKFSNGDCHGIYFSGSSFGDESTYRNITTGYLKEEGNDVGGQMICRNRIFECDTYFNSCNFYQAPDFFGTRFIRVINFESSKFLPSSFKYEYHSFYRFVKSEMARINLYREERNFWSYEERCLEEPSVTLQSWNKIPIQKPISFLKKLLNKKPAIKNPEFFFTYHGFLERFISKMFDLICKRGVSFNRIIASIFLLPITIFPLFYLLSDNYFWFSLRDCLSCTKECPDLNSIYSMTIESLRKSFFYTTHPFSEDVEIKKLEDYKFSVQLIISYIQSIIQIPTYVIFGFMLRKRFRMSGN